MYLVASKGLTGGGAPGQHTTATSTPRNAVLRLLEQLTISGPKSERGVVSLKHRVIYLVYIQQAIHEHGVCASHFPLLRDVNVFRLGAIRRGRESLERRA